MTAFAQQLGRRTRIHGTLGDLFFDQKTITIRTFGDNNTEVIQLGDEAGAHGGGDARVIQSWLNAIARNNPDLVLTSLPESLRTHTLVFAAEQARRERRIVRLEEMYAGSPRPNGAPIAIPASPSGGSNQGPKDSNSVWNSQL
jgi:predicted dehydrogenase